MLLLDVESLRPGQHVAVPVRHPQRHDTVLVSPGVALDARMIELIRRLGVGSAWVCWPGLEALDGRLGGRAADLHEKLFALLAGDFADGEITRVGVKHYVRYCTAVSSLVVELLSAANNGSPLQTTRLFEWERGLFSHSANVAYLSLALALRLQSYLVEQRRAAGAVAACDVTNLGVGALLHDIGKLRIPSTLTMHEPSEAPPAKSYAAHPVRGYRMVTDRISPTARAVILHHHQRFDGGGFPDMASVTRRRREGALAGGRIHIFSRIVSLCDAFENLCWDDQSQPRPVVAALHELATGPWRSRFDPTVLGGLLRAVPPFALGSLVRLSDGRLAAVIDHNARRPCRPKVRLLHESDVARRDVDLADGAAPHVRESLGRNVESWLYEPPADEARPAAPAVAEGA